MKPSILPTASHGAFRTGFIIPRRSKLHRKWWGTRREMNRLESLPPKPRSSRGKTFFFLAALFLMTTPLMAQPETPKEKNLQLNRLIVPSTALRRSLRNPFVPQTPIAPAPKPEPPRPKVNLPRPQPSVTGKPQPQPAPKPSTEKTIPKPHYAISGLIWQSDKPQAIVDDKIVTVGDLIGDWKITGISSDGVDVEHILYPQNTYRLSPLSSEE